MQHGTDKQTHRRAWPIHISPQLCLTQNVSRRTTCSRVDWLKLYSLMRPSSFTAKDSHCPIMYTNLLCSYSIASHYRALHQSKQPTHCWCKCWCRTDAFHAVEHWLCTPKKIWFVTGQCHQINSIKALKQTQKHLLQPWNITLRPHHWLQPSNITLRLHHWLQPSNITIRPHHWLHPSNITLWIHHWLQPLNIALQPHHWLQPSNIAFRHHHWLQPSNITFRPHQWLQPSNIAFRPHHWLQPSNITLRPHHWLYP